MLRGSLLLWSFSPAVPLTATGPDDAWPVLRSLELLSAGTTRDGERRIRRPGARLSAVMNPISRRTFTWLAALAPASASRLLGQLFSDVGRLGGGEHELTLLYTNDFHSAFDPIPAYWLEGSPRLGGAAHLAALIERERAAAKTSFLLDSGDMFTGTMSLLTQGEALMEMMTVMGYDAMGVGNHEFDYGWEVFERQITRVPFPILCCNVRYKGACVPFCRPYTILERDGVRLGVVGVMGWRAARFTIMPSKVAELAFTDPVEETAACVEALRPAVDVVVVLAHQGLPGPMQTDAENDPSVQRPLDEDLAFCGQVPGIDVYIAAHSHRGIETPIVHPETGTLLVQTYGYGTRLGVLRLQVRDRKVVGHRGELLKVWSDELPAHAAVASRVAHYRQVVAPQIGPELGRATRRFIRKYNRESPLGGFVADVMRERVACEVGITNAGGLRADLPEGGLHRGHVLDALPFLNSVVALELSGRDLRAVVEQGVSLSAGMVQVSGLRAVYDLARPAGSRVVDLRVGDQPLGEDRLYRVATNSFLAEGGDRYLPFRNGREIARDALIADCVIDHLTRRRHDRTPAPGSPGSGLSLLAPSRGDRIGSTGRLGEGEEAKTIEGKGRAGCRGEPVAGARMERRFTAACNGRSETARDPRIRHPERSEGSRRLRPRSSPRHRDASLRSA